MDDRDPVLDELRARHKDVLDLCWWNNKRELLLLRGNKTETYLERHSWPDDCSFVQTDSNLWETGMAVVAPVEAPYAAVLWIDQGESGFEIINLRTMEPVPAGSFSHSELLRALAFTPDDRLIVAVFESHVDADDYPATPPPQVNVGSIVIATVGIWDYLEIPFHMDLPPGRTIEQMNWPPLDKFDRLTFSDARNVSLQAPGGREVCLDLEQLRTDPRWIDAQARKLHAEKEAREEEKKRIKDIWDHNSRALVLAQQLNTNGLTCPYCNSHGQDFRHHPGTGVERALIVCLGCGRSFPV